jgi:hypothetical protein
MLVAGTVVTVGSLIAAFFTVGVALPIAGIVGAVTAGMGAAAAGGASGVNLILRTNRVRLINTALRKDDEKVNELKEMIQRVEKEKSVPLFEKACHISKIGIPTVEGIYSTVKSSVQLVDTSIINGAESAFATLSTASQVLHGLGFAFSGLSLAFDIHTIVTKSIAVHKGKVLPVVEEIRKIAQKLNQDKLLHEPAIRQKIKILEE